jgi:1,2-phenylacetyl-CoA epoxidase catalytic subunit
MSHQAYAEEKGATELAAWIPRAQGHLLRLTVARIAADEARHAHLIYRELEGLGVSEAEAHAIVEDRGRKGERSVSLAGPLAVGSAENDWADIVLNHMLLDRAGRHMIQNYTQASYAPWAMACQKILKDEYFHESFGLTQFRRLLAGTADRGELLCRFSRWYALALNFFGPPSIRTSARLRDYGIKRLSNDELRTAFVAEVQQLMSELSSTDMLVLENDSYPYRPGSETTSSRLSEN